ncbi:MAG TPA: Rieske 2Fe-2S domain-containing protein [Candidatus Acidoferrales bacterium]|nr:Rieske 2Fe-2S domain-containing protein [Candidatus Acidoferrales bacterium]
MLSAEENQILTRTGPGTPMGELLRRYWLPALLPEELPGPDCAPVRVRLLSEDLVAFKDSNGRLGLIDAYCAHRRAHLFFGRNEECGIRCIYHGWKFDVDGNCVDMPTEPPESSFRDKVKLVSYPLREHGGILWAYMGPKERMPELPQLTFTAVPASHRFVIKRFQESNYAQALEGGIDSAHTSYLHTTLDFHRRTEAYLERAKALRERFEKEPRSLNPEELDFLFRTLDKAPRVMAQDTAYGLIVAARRGVGDQYYWRFNQFLMPFYTMPPRGPGGHAFVPIDDERCWVWTFGCRLDRPYTVDEILGMKRGTVSGPFGAEVDGNYFPLHNKANDFLIDREIQRTYNFTGIVGTGNQDMAAQVSMGPVTDRTKEHLGVTDVGIIEMRRLLIDSAKDLCEGREPRAAAHPEAYAGVQGVSLVRARGVPLDRCVQDAIATFEKTRLRAEELKKAAA